MRLGCNRIGKRGYREIGVGTRGIERGKIGGNPNKTDTQVRNAMLGESTAFGAESDLWVQLVAWVGQGKVL